MAISEGYTRRVSKGVAQRFEFRDLVSEGTHTLVLAGEFDMATSPDVIKNKRPQLLAMVRCWTKAMDIVRDAPREASALVRRYFPDMEDGVYNTAFDKYRKGVPTSPMVVPDQLEKLIKFMHISKGTPVSATLSEVFYPDIAEEVIKATGRRS